MAYQDAYVLGASPPFEVVSNGEVTVDLELKKRPPRRNTLLTGRVSCRCEPSGCATVKVFDCCDRPVAHASTDQNGVYRFEDVLAPGDYLAIASAPGCKTSNARYLQIEPYKQAWLDFSLHINETGIKGIVYGKVLREGGQESVGEAFVTLAREGNGDGLAYEAQSNADGQYILYGIQPANYFIRAQKAGYAPTVPVKLVVSGQDMIKYDIVLAVSRHFGAIGGKITHRGEPMPNTAVFLCRLDMQNTEMLMQVQATNRDGAYLFSGVMEGTYLIKASPRGRAQYTRRVIVPPGSGPGFGRF